MSNDAAPSVLRSSDDAPIQTRSDALAVARQSRRKRPPAPPQAIEATEAEPALPAPSIEAVTATGADVAEPATEAEPAPQVIEAAATGSEPTEPEEAQYGPPAELLEFLVDRALSRDENRDKLIAEFVKLRKRLTWCPVVDELLEQLRGIRGFGALVKATQARLRNEQQAAQIVDPSDLPAGVPSGWITPAGYRLDRSGIHKTVEKGEALVQVQVALQPLWIDHVWKDYDLDTWEVQLRWPGGSEVIGREVALSSRELVKLAGKGAPVSSDRAGGLVEWLATSENHNRNIIPLKSSISRVGWVNVEHKPELQTPKGPFRLRAEEGLEQAARAVAPQGSKQDWIKAAKVVNAHRIPALMLAASVASVMLEPTKAAPFVIDLHGLSSRGKTTALRWAASAWADPSDSSAYLLPWSATLAAIEARASFLHHLPLCLDDTKKVPAHERERLASVVYHWGNGQGKARGRPDGARRVNTWKSILLSTGEAPLTGLAGEHGGARLRVLSINGIPFEGEGAVAAVKAIESLASWGHLGPDVAEWATKHWPQLRDKWDGHRTRACDALGNDPEAGRLAGYVASIKLGCDALVALNVFDNATANAVWGLCIEAGKCARTEADISEAAWHHIVSWLTAHSAALTGGASTSKIEPPSGWIGRYDTPTTLLVAQDALVRALREGGYDAKEIIPRWVKASPQRLQPGKDGNLQVVKWLGKANRMYRLTGLDGWEPVKDSSKQDKSGNGGTHHYRPAYNES